MDLSQGKRGTMLDMSYVDPTRAMLKYDMPLSEVIVDFYDQLKSRSQGYASLDYEFGEYRVADLVRLDILVAGTLVDALSIIVHREKAQHMGRLLVSKLRGLIPKQMFDVRIQAAIGGKIIASENVSAKRKDVIAKCYGGDITRKRKLLDKQKEGKKRMKMVGSVEIPQEAFLAVLRIKDDA
jgi:GTP-binding protein LepA